MTELSGPLAEFLAEIIPQEAAQVHSSYRLVPAEDIAQEMWATAMEKREGLERLVTEQEYGKARRRVREGGWRIVREDDRYRRAVKAARAGYEPVDEQFYTDGMIRKLIPMYLDNGVTERPPQGRELREGRPGRGAGSDYMAMMLDIADAMSRVREYHRAILERYYAYPTDGTGHWTHLQIAGALGIEPEALRKRVYRARRAIRQRLGGRNPHNRRALEYQDAGGHGAIGAA